MEKPARYFRVIEAYQSPYPHPIIFHAGEEVTVGREFSEDPDWKDWVWCEGQHGNKAWAPKQYLKMEAGRGVFQTEYNALELSVSVGEVLKVYKVVNGFGMAENSEGRLGWIPMRNLSEIKGHQSEN